MISTCPEGVQRFGQTRWHFRSRLEFGIVNFVEAIEWIPSAFSTVVRFAEKIVEESFRVRACAAVLSEAERRTQQAMDERPWVPPIGEGTTQAFEVLLMERRLVVEDEGCCRGR